MIQAVILAGGKGTRLRPLTDNIPKPMVQVAGRPFLEYVLQSLSKHGIKKILFLVSYLGQQIEDYFSEGERFNCEIEYCYEKSPMGTGGALKGAKAKLADEFLLLNGDTLLPLDYTLFIQTFFDYGKRGLVAAYDNHEHIVANNIRVDKQGVVVEYCKESDEQKTHVDAGVIAFKKDVVELIPEQEVCSLEGTIFPELMREGELKAFVTNQRFYDMGSFQGLDTAEEVLKGM